MQNEPQGGVWWQVLLQMVFAFSRNPRDRRSDFHRSCRCRLNFPKISTNRNWIIPDELSIKCERSLRPNHVLPAGLYMLLFNFLLFNITFYYLTHRVITQPCIISEQCHGLSPSSTCTCQHLVQVWMCDML